MGRNGHGPKWSWAKMVMGRNDPESVPDMQFLLMPAKVSPIKFLTHEMIKMNFFMSYNVQRTLIMNMTILIPPVNKREVIILS